MISNNESSESQKPDRTGLKPIVKTKLHEKITNALKQYISENKLRDGDRLPTERELTKSLRVSRTALREALQSMEDLGLIESVQGKGRRVRDFNFDAILQGLSYSLLFHTQSALDAIQVRQAVEAFFVKAAITKITPDDKTRLSEALKIMADPSTTYSQIGRADHEIHATLLQRAGNPLALQLFEIAWQVEARGLATFAEEIVDPDLRQRQVALKVKSRTDGDGAEQIVDPETRQRLVSEHKDLIDAVIEGDVAGAQKAILLHQMVTESLLREARNERGTTSSREGR